MHVRRIWILLLLMLLAAAALFSLLRSRDKGLNIILISVDSTRPDRLGCYGNSSVKTPNIDALAQRGVIFSSAIAPAPCTLPSHASLLTGTYPLYHGVRNNGTLALPPSRVSIAEVMREGGYTTAAIIGSAGLDCRFGLDQGFSLYDDRFSPKAFYFLGAEPEREGEEITRLALHWLKENGGSKFFLFLHYFDPHFPYNPPSSFQGGGPGRLYEEEIAYVDACLGELFQDLEDSGLEEETLVVLTSGNGEDLEEHGEETHGIFVYDSTIRVPLIFSGPAPFQGGEQIEDPVCLVDVAPTLLEAAGLSIPAEVQGSSLLPFFEGKREGGGRKIFFESFSPRLDYGWAALEGIRSGEWKYMRSSKPELYHLASDPGEKRNLINQQKEKAQELSRDLESLRESLAPAEKAEPGRKNFSPDPQTIDLLRLLGYKPEGGLPAFEMVERPDPKEMGGVWKKLEEGTRFLKSLELEKAAEAFAEVIQKNPHNPYAHNMRGVIFSLQNKREEAKTSLLQALSSNPYSPEIYNRLGEIFLREGDTEKAELVLLKGLEWNDRFPLIHYQLALVYDIKGDLRRAKRECQQALSLHPDLAEALIELGKISRLERDFEAAAQFLDRAERLAVSPGILILLAEEYLNLKEEEKAKKCIQKANFITTRTLPPPEK